MSLDNNAQAAIPDECQGSAQQILDYVGLAEERAFLFMVCLDAYVEIKDKLAVDKGTMDLRDSIVPVFWEVYESAARRLAVEGDSPRIVKMFINYGYMDERLLTADQVNLIWDLAQRPPVEAPLPVTGMSRWLEKIYHMEVAPSINEYGQDYFEVFREKRKRGEVQEKDKMWWESNQELRLKHEVEGLAKMGQRLSFGRIAGYFPILHSQMFSGDLGKALVTPERVEASLRKILATDHTAFHREIVYHQPEKGIVQQLIMKQVLPEVILVPTYGKRGVMWQELTGRQSASAGRFVVPVFCGEDLDLLLIDLVAKFRWYISKSLSSSMRKEASTMSLYSDYSSYLQFYKKNRDLSIEAREKIKVQLDRYRNNMADIYSQDYRTWVLFESKGLMRLNKVAREILFRYCPFPRPLREKMERQPMFNQMINQYNNVCEREAKSLEARYNRMNKSGGPLDLELQNNIQFYLD